MKRSLFVIVCLLLAACDFTVSLSDNPEMTIDRQAVGLWERVREEGRTERMLVLPINEREYFLSWPEGAPTELYARAHLFEFNGKTLVQLEWFGNSDGVVPDDNVVFQVAAYSINNDNLEIQLLNPDVVGKDHKSSADLANAIQTSKDNPALFNNKMVFKRILENN